MYSNKLILSDNAFRTGSTAFPRVNVFRIPVSPLLLMHKMYVDVNMLSLTQQSYRFWKVIRNQQEAVGSIFQPITGKIASQFIQTGGSPAPITGMFYTAGTRKLTIEITRDMVIPQSLFADIPLYGTDINCLELYPNATNVKPDFWVD